MPPKSWLAILHIRGLDDGIGAYYHALETGNLEELLHGVGNILYSLKAAKYYYEEAPNEEMRKELHEQFELRVKKGLIRYLSAKDGKLIIHWERDLEREREVWNTVPNRSVIYTRLVNPEDVIEFFKDIIKEKRIKIVNCLL